MTLVVVADDAILGYQPETLIDTLGDQDSVEGIDHGSRKHIDLVHMTRLNREHANAESCGRTLSTTEWDQAPALIRGLS